MSWQAQGRQYHMWFGHGTSAEDKPVDAAAQVVAGVGELLLRGRRAGYERYVAAGGGKKLAAAVRVWTAASGLDDRSFRSVVVGGGLPAEAAAGLRDLGRVLAGTPSDSAIQRGRAALARVIAVSGTDGDTD